MGLLQGFLGGDTRSLDNGSYIRGIVLGLYGDSGKMETTIVYLTTLNNPASLAKCSLFTRSGSLLHSDVRVLACCSAFVAAPSASCR